MRTVAALVGIVSIMFLSFQATTCVRESPSEQSLAAQEQVQFVMDAAVDHYEDVIMGFAYPAVDKQYFFDTHRDGGVGSGTPGDGVSTILLDTHDLLRGLTGNIAVMGKAHGYYFLVCAAWELNATNPRGAFVPPEECFDQS